MFALFPNPFWEGLLKDSSVTALRLCHLLYKQRLTQVFYFKKLLEIQVHSPPLDLRGGGPLAVEEIDDCLLYFLTLFGRVC